MNITNYKDFRFSKLLSPQYNHLLYALYWPFFGIMFLTVERLWIRDSYYPMYCPLDDLIPFCEWFIIPYFFWFVYLVGIHIYTLLFDTESFKRLMVFIMVSYTIAILIYILFPNCQQLRPVVFERDNVLTRFIAHFYVFDTNTNVFPSIHVIGSAATLCCAWHTRHFSSTCWRIAFAVMAVLISVSTVFLKQHSVLDLLGAIPVCAIAYIAAYGKRRRRKNNISR